MSYGVNISAIGSFVGVSYSGIIRASGARNPSPILGTPTKLLKIHMRARFYMSRCVEPTREFNSRHPDSEFHRFLQKGPVVKWYYTAFALPSRESDSRQVH